ncbi:MAG TPA: FimV/HubP family polar landmark protein [Azoarcus sp.]|nr:FimV/HubP family polar landmark protein [Azoarcus sp.]
MNKPLRVSIVAAALAAAFPSWVGAAGLGGVNLYSALGQPLRAEIQLQATAEELEGMVAKVPPAEVFQAANIMYSALMPTLDVEIDDSGGQSVVRVSSKRAVNEPVVEMLVELSWAEGRVVREYTLLLDPAEMQPLAATPMTPAQTVQTPAAQPAVNARTAEGRVYTVQRGDTLYAIGQRHQPSGVEIEQMMIALLRANPEAFISGNINRLRSGAQLNIPLADEAAAVAVADARSQVRTQREAFEAYRSRAAAVVATAALDEQAQAEEASAAASRESEGTVERRATEIIREEEPHDQVQVSGAPAAEGEGADLPASETGWMEEDAIAQNRALEEANSRVSDLERMVEDQQRALELKDEAFAKLQAQVEALQAQLEESRASVTVEERLPTQLDLPVASQSSFLDKALENPLRLGGGVLAVGLLGLLGVRAARRRREEKAFFELENNETSLTQPTSVESSAVNVPGGEQVDTDSVSGPSSMLNTDFSQSGLAAMDANEGVDPVAEADVYLAYGRDAQAEEILLDALQTDSSRHAIYVKLLEVYEQRGDSRQFETVATDFYSRTAGEGADWEKVVVMGRRLDPDNPLYGKGAAAEIAAAVTDAADENSTAASETSETPDVDFEALEFGMDSSSSAAPAEPETSETASSAEEDAEEEANTLDFDLDVDATQAARFGEEAAGESAKSNEIDLEKTEFDANVLDFDLDLSTPEHISEDSINAPLEEEIDLSNVEFDLDGELGMNSDMSSEAESDVDSTDSQAVAEPTQDEILPPPELAAEDVQREMETKLELARAYEDMGDKEGARELLEEVLRDGSDEQKSAARGMLDQLA